MTKNTQHYQNIKFDVVFSADICNPVNGSIIKCIIKNVNKLGLFAQDGPLSIIIPSRNVHLYHSQAHTQRCIIIILHAYDFDYFKHDKRFYIHIYDHNDNSHYCEDL